jgi:hypothetical protein
MNHNILSCSEPACNNSCQPCRSQAGRDTKWLTRVSLAQESGYTTETVATDNGFKCTLTWSHNLPSHGPTEKKRQQLTKVQQGQVNRNLSSNDLNWLRIYRTTRIQRKVDACAAAEETKFLDDNPLLQADGVSATLVASLQKQLDLLRKSQKEARPANILSLVKVRTSL